MILSRRAFFTLATATVATIAAPAFIMPRSPYVAVGELVTYIGLAKHPAPTFIGSTSVRAVEDWDGVGYPCVVMNQSFGVAYKPMPFKFYDADLSVMERDVPERFWHSEQNQRRYPNVHSFVREQRFGEDPAVMWRRLGYDEAEFSRAA